MRPRDVVAALALLGGAPAYGAIADTPGVPQVQVEVTRRGDAWQARFHFDRRVAAWVFPHSDVTRDAGKPWRESSWKVETRGVKLQRRGSYDVLGADRGDLPLRVDLRFTPLGDGLRADYSPALRFTDGSVALYVAQFECFPMDSLAEVRRLPGDLNNQMVPAAELHYSFSDAAGPVLLDGRRAEEARTSVSGTYVLFGAVRPIVTPDMIAVLDPQLPAWITQSLAHAVPAMLSRYTQELGPLQAFKPTLLVSWSGPTPGFVARSGSALRGLITMTYEGSGLLEESTEQRRQGLWFVAHEAAHFWLGQTVGYEYARDAWITEGGADLLAMRAVDDVDPGYDPRAQLDQAIGDCIGLTLRRGVESARERGEQRTYYACGTVFGLVAEAGSGRSFFRFVRALIEASRADGVVTRGEWLAALDSATRKPQLSRDIARLLDRGAADPREFITDLLVKAGVNLDTGADGMPHLR